MVLDPPHDLRAVFVDAYAEVVLEHGDRDARQRLAVHAGLAELVRVRVEVCRDVVLARPNVVRELAPERAHARGDVLDRPCRKGSRWEHRPEFWCEPEKSPRGPLGGIPLHLGAEW